MPLIGTKAAASSQGFGQFTAKEKLSRLTTVATASGTSKSIVAPSNKIGDILICAYMGQNGYSTVPTVSLDLPQTVIHNSTSIGNFDFPQYGTRVILAYQIVTSTVSAISCTSNANNTGIIAICIRPNAPVSSVSIKDLFQQWYTSGSGNTVSTTLSDNTVPNIYVGLSANWSNNRSSWSPYTNIEERESAANFGMAFARSSVGDTLVSPRTISRPSSQLISISACVLEIN